MGWTQETPDKDGLYWYSYRGEGHALVYVSFLTGTGKYLVLGGSTFSLLANCAPGWWHPLAIAPDLIPAMSAGLLAV